MDIQTGQVIEETLEVGDDVEVSTEHGWQSAKALRLYGFDFLQFKGMNFMVRNFSDPCQNHKCPSGGHCNDPEYATCRKPY